jgi:hypothetical protein
MNDLPETPPQSGPDTPDLKPVDEENLDYATPPSVISATPQPTPATPVIPDNLIQAIVNADPRLKRFQQDLLVLASFNDNSTPTLASLMVSARFLQRKVLDTLQSTKRRD